MRRLREFFKLTLLGGFGVLVPLLLAIFLIDKGLDLLVALVAPIGRIVLPDAVLRAPALYPIVAVALLALLSLALGLLLRWAVARKAESWLHRTLAWIPGYLALRRIVLGTLGDCETTLRPALLSVEAGARELAYVVEDHGDGRLTVLVPEAPHPFTGPLRLVPADRVELLDVELHRFIRIVGDLGEGLGEYLRPRGSGAPGGPAPLRRAPGPLAL